MGRGGILERDETTPEASCARLGRNRAGAYDRNLTGACGLLSPAPSGGSRIFEFLLFKGELCPLWLPLQPIKG
jgi:hypothetical protein